MDRIIKITLGLFLVILVVTIAFAGYNGYVTNAYQTTRTSSYSYTLSITTDSPLKNVTLFIPVPADSQGNSPIVSQFSSHGMPGVPGSWQTTLFDTGKGTLLKIFIPALEVPAGTTADKPYTVTLASELPSARIIDTANPLKNSPVFSPVRDLSQTACTGYGAGHDGTPECATFLTSLYADYGADPNAAVTITSSVSGKNSWEVFEPKSNEYITVINLLMHGENHGWAIVKGTMANRIGSYDDPFRLP
jgi:hypothetical protein